MKKKLCRLGIDPSLTHKPISQLLADLAGSIVFAAEWPVEWTLGSHAALRMTCFPWLWEKAPVAGSSRIELQQYSSCTHSPSQIVTSCTSQPLVVESHNENSYRVFSSFFYSWWGLCNYNVMHSCWWLWWAPNSTAAGRRSVYYRAVWVCSKPPKWSELAGAGCWQARSQRQLVKTSTSTDKAGKWQSYGRW